MTSNTERVFHVIALLSASLALALTGHVELAATAMGGALALVVPRIPPGAVVAFGVVAGAAVLATGCTPQQTLTALELARKLGEAVCELCP